MNSTNPSRIFLDTLFALVWSVGLLFMALMIPFFIYLIPLGAIGLGLVYAKHGEGKFYIALVWYGLAAYIVGDAFNPFIILTVVGLNGYALGHVFKKKLTPSISLVALTCAGILTSLLTTEILRVMSQVFLVKEYGKMLVVYEKEMLKTAVTQGESAVEMVKAMTMAMELLLPFFIILFAFIGAVVLYEMARVLYARLGVEVPKRKPLKAFNYPPTVLFGMFFISLVAYIASMNSTISPEMITANILAINAYVYAIQGVAVTLRFFERIKWSSFVAYAAIILLVVSNGVLMLGMIGFISVLLLNFQIGKDKQQG